MKTIVLDASTVLAWLLPSQATASADAFLLRADEFVFIAPHIFSWEVIHVLAVRSQGQTFRLSAVLDQLETLAIEMDDALSQSEMRQLADVAMRSGLSLFDASYLALAIEHDAHLASRDGALLTAASAAGVDVFDLRR